MTKYEAKQALNAGHIIRHRTFTDSELIMRCPLNGQLKDEDGIPINESDFWDYRQNEPFETGWSIVD